MSSAMPSAAPSPQPAPHLVIPFAAVAEGSWPPAVAALQALPPGSLKNTARLLKGMAAGATDSGDALSLSPPHERVLAAALGLVPAGVVDGLVPLAAWQARASAPQAAGRAWAQVTLCHWAMGREHATLSDPAGLGVTPEESAALLAVMQPYFATEGITLHAVPGDPGRWLAEGDIFRQQPTASLDRVLGRNVDPWLPGNRPADFLSGAQRPKPSPEAATLRRLQNEMQMLLYTHALNDARAERRQWPINSVWLSGTGALAGAAPAGLAPTVVRRLAAPTFFDDWAGWAAAWAALDAGEIAALLARQSAGETVRLSLCGERHAQTFETARPSFGRRLAGLFSTPDPLAVLAGL